MRLVRSDYDRWHDYSALINKRIIYFGSEFNLENDVEDGVDFASAKKVIKNLLFLDSLNNKQIILYINTPGGDEAHGMAIYDIIKLIKSPVKAIGIGQVMSMGSIIIQACKYRYLTKECIFMIHDGTFNADTDAKSFEAWGKYSKYFRERMYKIYYNKIKKKHPKYTKKAIENMCSYDNIMTAEQAVRLGLADKVI